jgi:hypothetical protein
MSQKTPAIHISSGAANLHLVLGRFAPIVRIEACLGTRRS